MGLERSYLVGPFADSHQEVVRFDIPMQEMPAMDILDTLNHHIKKHQHRFGS